MRSTSEKLAKPRRQAKDPITTLIAVLALAGGAQALAPAPAAAMDDQSTGATCVVQDGVLVNPETDELCTLGEETIAFSGSAPSTSPPREASETRTPCPGFACLRRGQRQIGDRDNLLGSPDGSKRVGRRQSRSSQPPPMAELLHLAEHSLAALRSKPAKGSKPAEDGERYFDLVKFCKGLRRLRDASVIDLEYDKSRKPRTEKLTKQIRSTENAIGMFNGELKGPCASVSTEPVPGEDD
jgi:hypothetical protein